MLADIHLLHQSDFYRITDWVCHCNLCSITNPEYNDSLCISFIRDGFFEYRTFRRNDEVHVGRILVSKPGFTHITKHIDDQPDTTNVLEFNQEFYNSLKDQYSKEAGWFLSNNDIHSLLLQSKPELDYLHHRLLEQLKTQPGNKLLIDEMVIELLERIMQILGNLKDPEPIPDSLKQFHLGTIELAKSYIFEHFGDNISLKVLASHCHVSLFHFSRIFKTILQVSPHQYLMAVRLDHAKLLLGTTEQPIADIVYTCGFNSIEHFATAFRQRFKMTPTHYRQQLA